MSCLLWGLGQCFFSWILLFEKAIGNSFLTFEFGEDEDNGHCVLSIFTKLLWGKCSPPFGSILSKNCNSASTTRRSLSVGMQYLSMVQGLCQQQMHRSLPDCMKLIPQWSCIRTFWYEGLNGFHFLSGASFNSARVVKYELRIAIKTNSSLMSWWPRWMAISSTLSNNTAHTPDVGSTWTKFSTLLIRSIRDSPCHPPLVQCVSELSFSLHSVGRWSVHGIAHISSWVYHNTAAPSIF